MTEADAEGERIVVTNLVAMLRRTADSCRRPNMLSSVQMIAFAEAARDLADELYRGACERVRFVLTERKPRE
jgi:hypothetical protein